MGPWGIHSSNPLTAATLQVGPRLGTQTALVSSSERHLAELLRG